MTGDHVTVWEPLAYQGNADFAIWDYVGESLGWKHGQVQHQEFEEYLEKILLPYLEGRSCYRDIDKETFNYFNEYEKLTINKLQALGIMDSSNRFLKDV
ncbi:hypothetical protein VKT23_005358 [Stygiomarasmius scandens]|uniref:Uncharacterized protein n=1 Tax=Marasmiellus scandens TaxID=2682957 RepID=A0ABR1JQV2_9AGAR